MTLFFRGNRTSRRCQEFSLHQGLLGCDLNVLSIETLRQLLAKHTPRRYRPLVALLRSGLRHRVMIVADGEDWQLTRDAINPDLQAGVVANEYVPVIRRVAEEAFSCLVGASSGDMATARAFDIAVEPLMRTVTLSILGHLLFGHVLSLKEAARMEGVLTAVTEFRTNGVLAWVNLGLGAVFGALRLGEYQPIIFPREQRQAAHQILGWISTKIGEAKRAGLRPPLLERLEARFAAQRPARRTRSIVGEYAMMMIAGIETTASALTLAIAEIASDSTVCDQVVRESRQQPAPSSGVQSVASQFPYLHCVFRETLRRHTIVPTFLRETEEEYSIRGMDPATGSDQTVQVPPGTTLRYLPLQGHMRRSVWADPHRFDPNRFAQPLSSEQSKNYIPFGFGPQRCPGHAMATTEAILILATFFRQFDLEHKAIDGIPMKRNIVFTNRPIGLTACVRPVRPAAL
jgi:cytochrome P450